MPEQQTYSMLLAVSVRVYGSVEIKANSPAEAAEIVRKAAEHGDPEGQRIWQNVSDVDYSTQSEYTIVSLDDDNGPGFDGLELNQDPDHWKFISAETLAEYMET